MPDDARSDAWRWVRGMPLAVRLALLSAALTAAIVCIAFWGLSVEIRANTRRMLAGELARAQRTVLGLQRRNLDQLVYGAGVITRGSTFSYLLRTYAVERDAGNAERRDLSLTMARELERTRLELGNDLLVVTDEAGRVFAAAGNTTPLTAGIDLTGLPAVRRALDPAAPSDSGALSVLRLGDAYYHVGVVPIMLRGFTAGAVLLGDRIDSAFVASLRSSLAGEVVVLGGGRVLVSTMADTGAATGAPRREGGAAVLRIGDDDYVVASSILGESQDGSRIELRLLQSTTPTVRALTGTLLRDIAWYGGVAVLVVALGAGLLARRLLRPLRAFVEYLRASARTTPLAPPPDDTRSAAPELATLHDSFGAVMSSLAEQQSALEQRSVQLAAANAVLTDEIRERERVEHALRESEAQLRQSQKLEAIGTLAGGVAHDFNNLLTVISGFGQLALMRTGRDGPVSEELTQIVEAADRAAGLTRQLLAFSRKQVMQVQVLDLAEVVAGIEPMLRRLAGESIDLRVTRAGDLPRIKGDPGQLEQVVINLVVNARDAMPEGGTLTIALENAAGDAPGTGAGSRAVRLRVTDTGTGMPDEIRERIFEPFFTTKEPGKGTGLGLATVYGIVQQSGGTIDVESVVGRGTTFRVVLPAALEFANAVAPPDDGGEMPRGTETILLAEDEIEVRALSQRCLEECGYRVVVAGSAVDALEIARRMDTIHLLLTDIVMPQMRGPQLAARFSSLHPGAAVVFVSGHADDAIMQLEIDPGTAFLRKPFTPVMLARLVREALDAPRPTGRLAAGARA